jgi:hypothetical protein
LIPIQQSNILGSGYEIAAFLLLDQLVKIAFAAITEVSDVSTGGFSLAV